MAMPRKRQDIKVNNSNSLEALMQETYNDACGQIIDAQKVINEMVNAAEPEDVKDHAEIAGQRTNALKIKDSAIKIKLELAKLQNEIIKNEGNIGKVVTERVESSVSTDEFSNIREMLKKQIPEKIKAEYKL